MARTANETTGVVGNASLTDPDGRLIVVGPDGDAIAGTGAGDASEATLGSVSDRLGDLTTPAAGSVNAQLTQLFAAVDQLEGYMDGVEGLLAGAVPAGTNTIGAVNVKPATAGGLTTYHLVAANSTNATVVKASAGQLFGWYIYNSNAAARKLAFHNAASTPTAGASVFFTATIPALSAANVEFTNGIAFSTGISITTVTGLADNDSTAVAANDLIVNLFYA